MSDYWRMHLRRTLWALLPLSYYLVLVLGIWIGQQARP